MTEEEELVDLIRQKLYHKNEAQAVRIIEQYKADIIKKTKEQLTIPNVILCDAPVKILPCRHKCFSLCQLRGHCNFQKDKV